MTIGLLRHNEVELPFLKGMVTQSQVLDWFRKYESAAVKEGVPAMDQGWDICYSSTLKRAKDTAREISAPITMLTELLNEPFPDPLFRSDIKLPFVLWGLLLRFAILNDHSSQSQGQKYLVKNLEEFLAKIEKQKDLKVLIVSHSFSIRLLSRLLVRRGYKGKSFRNPGHGVIYRFSKIIYNYVVFI